MPNFVNISLSSSVLLNSIEYWCIQNHSKDDVAKLLEIGCNDSFQPLVWKRVEKLVHAAITRLRGHFASTTIRNKYLETLEDVKEGEIKINWTLLTADVKKRRTEHVIGMGYV